MEDARDRIRAMLFNANPQAFMPGHRGTDVHELCQYMLTSEADRVYKQLYCTHCRTELENQEVNNFTSWHCSRPVWNRKTARLGSVNDQPTSKWLKVNTQTKSGRFCPTCIKPLEKRHVFDIPPLFIPLIVDEGISVKLEHSAILNDSEYHLIGIVYFGSFHFTCRVIDAHGEIWYNDGLATGRKCEYEGNIKDIYLQSLLQARQGRKCSMALYMLNSQE